MAVLRKQYRHLQKRVCPKSGTCKKLRYRNFNQFVLDYTCNHHLKLIISYNKIYFIRSITPTLSIKNSYHEAYNKIMREYDNKLMKEQNYKIAFIEVLGISSHTHSKGTILLFPIKSKLLIIYVNKY